MQNNSQTNFHVLIIGAGPSGLLIGQGLKQAGISYQIFEKSDTNTYQNRQRDWTMALHWGSEYLSTCLPPDILGRLREAESDPEVKLTDEQERFTPVHNGKTGELVLQVPATSTRRVSRERFRKLVSQGLNIRHGSRLVDIKDDGSTITATFEDGHTANGHALIGCDSANSYVRTWLMGEEQAECEVYPVITYNFTTKYTADQATYLRNTLHPLQKNAIHPDLPTWYVLPTANVPNVSDPTTWTFQHFLNIWTDDPKQQTPKTSTERLAHFKSIAARHCEPWRSAAKWVPDDTIIPHDKIKHWPKITRWHNNHRGRITLAGDAAHPMVPYRGQGLNNALQDAALYVQTLVEVVRSDQSELLDSRLQTAVDRYDGEVVERGRREIMTSAEQGYLNMHFDQFMSSPLVKHGLNKVHD